MRPAVTQASREKANFQCIRDGIVVRGAGGAAAGAVRLACVAANKALRGWAACLGRIFEVDPIKCRCGGTMKLIAVITEDHELDRLLVHQGIEVDFPKTRPARSPPKYRVGEDTQLDPGSEAWDGKDEEWPEA